MTDQNQAIRGDIAFMRALAEDGREGPMVGGSILVLFGVVYAGASLFTSYAIGTGLAREPLFFPIVWFGATALAMAVLLAMKLRQPRKVGAARAAGLAWAAAGWTICAIIASLMLIGIRTGNWSVMEVMGPVVLAIYGGAWFIAGKVSTQKWLNVVAFGAFLMAGLNAWFVTDPANMFLIYAASLIALLVAPGVVLMRQAGARA